MICTRCNSENAEGSRFCMICGATMVPADNMTAGQPAVPTDVSAIGRPVSGGRNKKKILLIAACAAAAVLLMIAAIGIISMLRDGGSTEQLHYFECYYLPDTDETAILYDGKLLDDRIDGSYRTGRSSDDGKNAILLTRDGEIYHLTSRGITLVADDLGFFYEDEDDYYPDYSAAIAPGGEYVLYIDEDGTLCTVKFSSKKRTEVAYDVEGFSLWHDKCITYTNEDGEVYFYNLKRSTLLGDHLSCLGVSENGKYVYLYEDEALYLTDSSGKNRKEIADGDDLYDMICYNESMSEILLVGENGKLMISTKGGDPVEIDGVDDIRYVYYAGDYQRNSVVGEDSLLGITLGIRQKGENTHLYYLNKKHELVRMAKNVSFVEQVNGYVYYERSDNLYRIKNPKDPEPEKMANDVREWYVTEDGKKVYYNDTDYILYVNDGKNGSVQIAEDVRTLHLSDDGVLYFIDEDDTLYRCTNAKNVKRIADDVISISVYPECIRYLKDNEDDDSLKDVYISRNGTDFKLVLEGVEW